MTAQAAIGLGIDFRVLASRGGWAGCDVVTPEYDRVPLERASALRAVRESGMRAESGAVAGAESRLVVIVARSAKGQGASYPVAEMTWGECAATEVIAPAPNLDDELAVRAQRLGLAIAAELEVKGVLAIELARDRGTGELVIRDLALGPHEGGLWTADAARTSQFEQLLRAVIDLPLGTTTPTGTCAATVTVVGGDDEDMYGRLMHVMAADPGVKVHLYATPAGPGQRIGHVTVADDDYQRARDRAWRAANYIGPGIDSGDSH
ncbi:MAG TPA: ATP-grasp domain-containing protein [Streptosporangiaceae bacterium]|nr:ATP-grasp domain-containing protein [Streptosporangiaceae bacterium]